MCTSHVNDNGKSETPGRSKYSSRGNVATITLDLLHRAAVESQSLKRTAGQFLRFVAHLLHWSSTLIYIATDLSHLAPTEKIADVEEYEH